MWRSTTNTTIIKKEKENPQMHQTAAQISIREGHHLWRMSCTTCVLAAGDTAHGQSLWVTGNCPLIIGLNS